MMIWLNQNAGAIQTIFGGLVFVATAYYVWKVIAKANAK